MRNVHTVMIRLLFSLLSNVSCWRRTDCPSSEFSVSVQDHSGPLSNVEFIVFGTFKFETQTWATVPPLALSVDVCIVDISNPEQRRRRSAVPFLEKKNNGHLRGHG